MPTAGTTGDESVSPNNVKSWDAVIELDVMRQEQTRRGEQDSHKHIVSLRNNFNRKY